MILHKVLRRGSDHPDHCEDFYAIGETPKFLYACVFDGCSGGRQSHFASTLFGKAFNDVMKTIGQILDSDKSLVSHSKILTYMMSRKISEVKKILNLDTFELLSTIVLCSINKETKECLIVAFGDGFFCVDGQEVMIKNTRFINTENGSNKPDYLAYDLDKIESYNDFEYWFDSKSEVYRFESVTDVSIATDGIGTFKQFKEAEEVNPIDFLVKDEKFMDTKIMLERKYNILNSTYKMTNTDDLSLIRIKF